MTTDEYKSKIKKYLQSPQAKDEVWEYVLNSLMDIAATQGLDFLDEQILSESEIIER